MSGNWRQQLAESLRLLAEGRLPLAEPLLRQVLAQRPRDADAHHALGVVLLHTHRAPEAVTHLQQAVTLKPYFVEAHGNLGAALAAAGRHTEAIPAFQAALRLQPDHPALLANYGSTLQAAGLLDEAVNTLHRAIALHPANADAHFNLANALRDQGRADAAIDAYQKALSLAPNHGLAQHNLAFVLRDQFRLDDALAGFRRALAMQPPFTASLAGIAMTLADMARHDESAPLFQQHLQHNPPDPVAHSSMLMAMQSTAHSAQAIHEASQLWARMHARPADAPAPPPRDLSPERRLRIGYVSPDFREHSVAYFFEPLLSAHHRDQVELFLYADVRAGDAMTRRLKARADHWVETASLSHAQFAARIRADAIDILVDLAGHTAGNRLPAFAQKPAPLQITYLGYPATTGLSAIDYRLTDAFADPPGAADLVHAEKLLRLPETFLCYRPPENAPDVTPPPATASHAITFGSFNVLRKMTPEVIRIWSGILQATPGARLLLKAAALQSETAKARLLEQFFSAGISPHRIECLPRTATTLEHLDTYCRMDIALDPFPYNGTTTTLEALWMGIPVITLATNRHAGRVGTSILTNAGFPELVAQSPDQYLAIASDLARDLPRLAALRATLRDRLKASPLMDDSRFAGHVETAYRAAWQTRAIACVTR